MQVQNGLDSIFVHFVPCYVICLKALLHIFLPASIIGLTVKGNSEI